MSSKSLVRRFKKLFRSSHDPKDVVSKELEPSNKQSLDKVSNGLLWVYTPLRPEQKQIRLISLQPGAWEDPISCSLSTVNLDDVRWMYETLSYVWNAEPGFGEIMLHGKPTQITKNLFQALRRLRKSTEPRIVWIDALCIDQESKDEKSHQVDLMGQIYQSCSKVFLWLGDYADGSFSDTRTLEHNDRFPWFGGTTVEDWTKDDKVYQAFTMIYEFSQSMHYKDMSAYRHRHPSQDNGLLDHEILDAFGRIIESPWWSRLWVVQETVLPPEAVLVFGSISIPWGLMEKAGLGYHRHSARCCATVREGFKDSHRIIFSKFKRNIFRLEITRKESIKVEGFHQLLWRYRTRKATDPRDMVYGLFGFASGFINGMTADYTLTKNEVYQQITLSCLENTQRLHILKGQRTPNENMPSWVYDWSSEADENFWHYELIRMYNRAYRASLDINARFHCKGSRLSIDGVLIDKVVAVAEQKFLGLRSIKPRAQIVMSWYKMCAEVFSAEEVASRTEYPVADCSWMTGFRRTIIADLAFKTAASGQRSLANRASVNEDANFEKWWEYVQDEQWGTIYRNEKTRGFSALINNAASGHKFFMTKSGYLGLGNPQVGDEIWVLLGGNVPFVLRPDTETECRYLVGDCFVHGIMDGEALTGLEKKMRTVILR
jgi:hypothetical protein